MEVLVAAAMLVRLCRVPVFVALVLPLSVGCGPKPGGDGGGRIDGDGDGAYRADDCDDGNPDIHPGATEVCNGYDDDCDGVVDGAQAVDSTAWYVDADHDGYGVDGEPTWYCAEHEGYAPVGGDCDDTDRTIHPDEREIWYDGVDQNCDGQDDFDRDGDGVRYGEGDCNDLDPELVTAVFGEDCAHPYGACDPESIEGLRIVPRDYATVQDALAAADPGDVVCVGPGTWAGPISFEGRTLRVVGALGAEVTVLDGGGLDSVVTFEGGETAATFLVGFTLTGGHGKDGGGINAYGDAGTRPHVEEVDIVGNESDDDGGGLYVHGAVPNLRSVRIADNRTFDSGGGIRIVEASPVFTDVVIERNVAGGAGGGLALRSAAPTISNVEIAENVSEDSGGGMVALESGGNFVGVVFRDNDAYIDGGGAKLQSPGRPSFEDVWFLGNHARGHGGGLAVSDGGQLDMRALGFVANVADRDGGAVHLLDVCQAGFSNLTAVANVSEAAAFTVDADCSHAKHGKDQNALRNAVFAYNSGVSAGAIDVRRPDTLAIRYVALYDADLEITGDSALLAAEGVGVVAPGFVSYHPAVAPERWDLHLGPGSLLRDAGDPDLLDDDGSASDIGAYGGLGGGAEWYADADGDGLYDGWEAGWGLDPSVASGQDDPDADGLDNVAELAAGTCPITADTDGDGLLDGEEVTAGLDPLDPAG